MQLPKRLQWILIACALVITAITGIWLVPNVKNLYFNNYREVWLTYPYQLPGFIKKDSCKNIKLEHININNLGDVICYGLYRKNRGFMLWQVKELSPIPLSKIKFADSTIESDNHFVFKKIKSAEIRYPCIAMVMEPTLDTALSLNVYVEDAKRDTSIITPNYIYCDLNFSSIRFYRNNKFNFLITKYPSAGCDFMMCKYKGTLYMMYLYSLNPNPDNPSPVKPGDLLKILDL